MKAATSGTRSMSDASVHKATGKKWSQWFSILDRAGARKMAHRDIAMLLHKRHKVRDWWCQMVTVEYERARGLREKYQTAEGFVANVSRTFDAPVGSLYKAWTDARRQRRWLNAPLTVTTANTNKSLRIRWGTGDSRVDVYFTPKGARRCQMAVQHRRLARAAQVRSMKDCWARAFDRLQRLV